MQLLRILLISSLAFTLIGCGTPVAMSKYGIQDRETAYLNAKSIAPTKIPPGLTSNGFRNYYPVSLRQYPNSEKQVSIVPPGLPGAA